MMALEPRKPTAQQRVFDALGEVLHLSTAELASVTGLTECAVRQALIDLKRKGLIECCQRAPIYRLMPNGVRPVDMRGRKRA